MAQIVDYVTFLQQAKVEVLNLRALKARQEQGLIEQRRGRRELEEEKRAAEEDSRRTVKTRREETAGEYDRQIAEMQGKLRGAKGDREDAKGEGVKARIGAETAQLQAENAALKEQIGILFKKYYVPRFCNSWLYYAIYCPKWIEEYLVLILSAAVGTLALPQILYRLLPVNGILWAVLVYIVFDAAFIGLFGLVGGYIREDHITPLSMGRELRDQIRRNKKEIRAIARNIRRDKNEDAYDLGHYDERIGQLKQEIEELNRKKEEALAVFDRETAPVIAQETAAAHQGRIDELTAACEKKAKELADLEAAIAEKTRLLDENYAPHVGRDFLEPERLDALKEIVEEKHITSLSEALDAYRERNT